MNAPKKITFKTTNPQMKVLHLKTSAKKLVEFKNHLHETFNEEIAEFIRNHPHFKSGTIVEIANAPVVEEEKAAETKPEGETESTPDATADAKLAAVTSKSTAIAYLMINNGIDATELKNKNVAEIKAIALEKYGITFPSWE